MKLFKKFHRGQDPGRSGEIPPPSPSSSSPSPLPSPSPSPSCATAAAAAAVAVAGPSPPSPAETGRGAGAGLGEKKEDYITSEEEFQVQLAMALSASNSEFRGEDLDGDQIRAATLLSLGEQRGGGRRREEEGGAAAEALSRRYWEYNVLDYHEKVVDGFYDIFGLSSGSENQGKLPPLVDLQTSIGDFHFEVILVSRAIDPALVELEQVAQCISMDSPVAEVGLLVQRIAELVTEHMGGPVRDASDMLAQWMEKSTEVRTLLQTSLLPLGCVNVGLSRHRALLFKVLADTVGIPCRLVKGSHYTGVDDDAINIIKLDNDREFLVDLMAAPGTLIPADVLSAKDAQRKSYNSILSKDLIPWEANFSRDDLLRAERLHCEFNGGNATHALDNKSALDKRSRHEQAILLPSTPSSSSGVSSANIGSSSNSDTLFPHGQSNHFPSPSDAISSKQKGVLEVPLGSASRMNESFNIVPNAQDTVDFRNLFAELNPFQITGARKPSAQFKATDYKNTEYDKRMENIASGPGRPQYPLVWKNRPACNEIPNAKQYNFVEGLLPRNNVGVNDQNASSSHPSTSAGKIHSEGPNTNVCSIPYSGVGTSANGIIVSSAGNSGFISSRDNMSSIGMGMNQHGLLDSGCENAQADKLLVLNQSSEKKYTVENQTQGLVLQNNVMHEPKEHGKNVKGKNDRKKCTHDRFMGTELASKNSESSIPPVPAEPSRLDPMLDDVAQCEIRWEDLVIGERIGLGSYGEVYHADWNGKEVAVKKFLDQDFYGDALDEFRSEVRIMRRLRHPNVVRFMGAVTRPPNLSIVSEFLPRGSLYRILHRPSCQIDEKRRIKMALDVANGMNCLHTSTPTIVHRDLKSPNLLVHKNWTVKVCDFGLSRLKHSTFLSSKSTAGTPEWMAPEVLRNEPSNEKCDVYSFGVILWELATLRMPWSGMNPMQVVGAVGFQDRRLDIPKEVDPLVARIIWECWQTDPSLRPSFVQLITAINSLQRLVIPSYQETQSPPVPQEISVNSTP